MTASEITGRALAAISALALGCAAYADLVVLDQTFTGDTLGVRPTSNISPSGLPMTQPQALGAFINIFAAGPTETETNPPAAVNPTIAANGITFDTQNVAGLTKALVVTSTAATGTPDVDVPYYDNNFVVPAVDAATLSFDFAQLSNPGGSNGGFRSDFLVVAYRTGGNIAFAIGTKHDTPGQIYLQYPAGVNVPIGTYTLGVSQRIDMNVWYKSTGFFDVYIDGIPVASLMSFNNAMTGPTDQIKEIFVQYPTADGGTNSVAIDNLLFILQTPEPMSAGLLGLGLLLIGRRSARA